MSSAYYGSTKEISTLSLPKQNFLIPNLKFLGFRKFSHFRSIFINLNSIHGFSSAYASKGHYPRGQWVRFLFFYFGIFNFFHNICLVSEKMEEIIEGREKWSAYYVIGKTSREIDQRVVLIYFILSYFLFMMSLGF